MASPGSVELQQCLERMHQGDEDARRQLLTITCDRLKRLTRKMLNEEQRVHRWEETDDVMQNAMLRLWRMLSEVTPPTLRDFFRLAALQIRRELIDLARHYYGPQGLGAHYDSRAANETDRSDAIAFDPPESGSAMADLERWFTFHEAVENLPPEEREVVSLIFYHGWTQVEVAALLQVSEKTVRRRWQDIRLKLHSILKGNLPQVVD